MLDQHLGQRPPANGPSSPAVDRITARPNVRLRKQSPRIRQPLPDGEYWDPDERGDAAATNRNEPTIPSPFALVERLETHLASNPREPSLFRFAATELNETNLPALIDHIDFTTTARQHVKKDGPSERTIAVAASKRKLSTSIRFRGRVWGDKCRKCKMNGIECIRAEKTDRHGTDKCAHCVSVGKPCVLPEVCTPRSWQHQRDPLSVLDAALAPPLQAAEQEDGRYTHGVWVIGDHNGRRIQQHHVDDEESDEADTIIVPRREVMPARNQAESRLTGRPRVPNSADMVPSARHNSQTPHDVYRGSWALPVAGPLRAASGNQKADHMDARGATRSAGKGAAGSRGGDPEAVVHAWGLDDFDPPNELDSPDRHTAGFESGISIGVQTTMPAIKTTSGTSNLEAAMERKGIAVEEPAKGKPDMVVTNVSKRDHGRVNEVEEIEDEDEEERREFARRKALMDDLWMPKLSSYQLDDDDDDDDDDDTSLDEIDRGR